MKSENKLAGLGVLTAISASLCCITPILALLAGTSGLVSTFYWLDPLKPYLIGLTIFLLGFAWYQKLKPQKKMHCNCDTSSKTPFVQTKKFLGIVTVFAGLMLVFPVYAPIFYPKAESHTIVAEQSNIKTSEFKIKGMTCSGCEEDVTHEVIKLKGIIKTTVSYKNGSATIEFDKAQTNVEKIERAIRKSGYSVTDNKELK